MQPRAGAITVDGVTRSFDTSAAAVLALDRVSLEIAPREFVCLVGPSGCGKSTLLNILAGFESPTEGQVLLGGQPIRGIAPDRGVVFQTPTLFPWLTVWDNVVFGPKRRGFPPAEYVPEAEAYLREMGLNGFERHYPYQLSGGMRQRVQIARVLMIRPSILLMDEPFGALDFQSRLAMQELLLRICERHAVTVLFITHDVEEALLLGDRVLVMTRRPGRIKREVRVPFGRPRTLELIASEPFTRLKWEILGLVRQEAALGDSTAPTNAAASAAVDCTRLQSGGQTEVAQ